MTAIRRRGRPPGLKVKDRNEWVHDQVDKFRNSSSAKGLMSVNGACQLIAARGGLEEWDFVDGTLQLVRAVRGKSIRARYNDFQDACERDPHFAKECEDMRRSMQGSPHLRARGIPSFYVPQPN